MQTHFKYDKEIVPAHISGPIWILIIMVFVGFSTGSPIWSKFLAELLLIAILVVQFKSALKFNNSPSEIVIEDECLVLKFRNNNEKKIAWQEIESIERLRNPIMTSIYGEIDIKVKNSNESYHVYGNIKKLYGSIKNFQELVNELSIRHSRSK